LIFIYGPNMFFEVWGFLSGGTKDVQGGAEGSVVIR